MVKITWFKITDNAFKFKLYFIFLHNPFDAAYWRSPRIGKYLLVIDS